MVLPAPTRNGRRVARAGPRLAAVACCVALGAAACGSDDAAGPEPTTDGTDRTGITGASAPGTSAPGTTAVAGDEAAVLDAVDGYWRTWLAANDPPNPDHPDLEKYATGPALERARAETSRKVSEGLVTQLPANSSYGHTLSIALIKDHHASVTDCVVDDLVQVNSSTGSIANDSVVTELLTINLTKEEAAWRVESIERVQQWQGVNESCS